MDKTIKTLTEVLKDTKKEGTTPYDTTATVVRIEGNTAWCHIPGGIDETPVSMTIDAREGDTVQVRVSGGRAWITGNASAPPTDDTVAKVANEKATVAEQIAIDAQEVATETNQYFWFTPTGSDTGAHISEVPQEQFTNPNSPNYHAGGNLLARSNGISVREGVTDICTFGIIDDGQGNDYGTVSFDKNNLAKIGGYRDEDYDSTNLQLLCKTLNAQSKAEILLGAYNDYPGVVSINTRSASGNKEASAWFRATDSSAFSGIQLNAPAGTIDGLWIQDGGLFVGLNQNEFTVDNSGNTVAAGSITQLGHSGAIGETKYAYLATQKSIPTGISTGTEVCHFTLDAGVWMITAYVRWSSNSTGYRLANISTNSGNNGSNIGVTAVNGTATTTCFTRVFTPSATTTYYLNALHNAGTPLTLSAGNADGTINGMVAVRIA